MGSSKRHQRNMKPQAQTRSRTTRSTKGRLLSDPAQNTQLLTEQLRSLGLYAAPTLGDGNCLFRALSDQLYGTPSHHHQLRKDICDWIESHKQRYEPFVEDDRGFDVHLQCMRENGGHESFIEIDRKLNRVIEATYGGHMELSAFAHLTRRNVKVIQPGLVYVIEWSGGGDVPDVPDPTSSSSTNESLVDDREKRRLRREKKREGKEKAVESSLNAGKDTSGTIYVAYHDWEHFSSIRNLRGPHTGPPSVTEITADDTPPSPPLPKKPISKMKQKPPLRSPSKPLQSIRVSAIVADETDPPTPSQIPLPYSRSPSPSIDISHSLLPLPNSSNTLSPRNIRINRSPKRTFDESSGSSATSECVARRTRSRLSSTTTRQPDDGAMDMDDAASTPGLSAPGSSADSSSSLSDASSPHPPTPPPASSPPPERERPLTRRQRKAMGLPKTRAALIAARNARGAGKIVIPGGRFKKGLGQVRNADDGDEDEEEEDAEERAEWRRNGTGRVDVRGFRELKI